MLQNILPLHDIDGVLRNFTQYAIEQFIKQHPKVKSYMQSPEKVRGWSLDNFVKNTKIVPKLEEFLFKNPKTSHFIFSTAPILPAAKDWLTHYQWLKDRGIPVVLCTAQRMLYMREATLEWVDKNNIKHDDIIFVDSSTTKHFFGNMILDDRPETIETFLSLGKEGIIFPQSYNESYIKNKKNNNEKIKIARSLKEYRNYISEAPND